MLLCNRQLVVLMMEVWIENPAYIHIKQRTELSEYIVLYGIL